MKKTWDPSASPINKVQIQDWSSETNHNDAITHHSQNITRDCSLGQVNEEDSFF